MLAMLTGCTDQPPSADPATSSGAAETTTATNAESSSSTLLDDGTSAAVPLDMGGGDASPVDPPDGEPLPEPPIGEWQWIEIEGASCRDGSQAGFAFKRGSIDSLMIYFDQGGACFNAASCFITPALIDPQLPTGGLFEARADNPVADWHQVFLPYCTGDVHAGLQPNGGSALGTQDQHFVGWRNVGLYLARLHPTFPELDDLLVTGSSAGGFGAAANLERIAAHWPDAQITMIDDSGMPFADGWLAPCLQARWRQTWGIDDTFLSTCGSPCLDSADGGNVVAMLDYLQTALPDANLGFVSNTEDLTMRQFFGYGVDDCAMIDAVQPPVFPAEDYYEGLLDLRERLYTPRAGSYFLAGEGHIVLTNDGTYAPAAGGVRIVDWVAAAIEGNAANIGP